MMAITRNLALTMILLVIIGAVAGFSVSQFSQPQFSTVTTTTFVTTTVSTTKVSTITVTTAPFTTTSSTTTSSTTTSSTTTPVTTTTTSTTTIQTQPRQSLILSTTTSTFDSGLLDYLLPLFENRYNAKVSVLSKGTGESIAIAQRGDADVVLVHARSLEEAFINSTYGVHRVGIMYNDFIVIGPATDPAGIKGMDNATKVFSLIMEAGKQGKTVFISRADKSGTNTKELEIWAKLGVTPTNRTASWYIEAGAGMGTVLRMANEKKAYTLTDRATWVSFKAQLTNLALLVEKDKVALLLNPYAVILVNPEKYPQRNYKTALLFAKFMVSEEGQKLIETFKKEGETLFFPMARDISKANQLGFPKQAQEIAWYDSQQLL